MWEKGHTFPEIDAMSLEDFGDVLGYWEEMSMIDKKKAQTRKNLARGAS